MYGLVVLMVMLFVHSPLVQSIVPLLSWPSILIMLVEGIFIGCRVVSLAAASASRGEHPRRRALRGHARPADPQAAGAQAAGQARRAATDGPRPAPWPGLARRSWR